MSKNCYVYILGSKSLVLYIGLTSNLVKRIYEHKKDLVEGFTKKYKVHTLLYYEIYDDPENAIKREKQLKNWHRGWKLNLIKSKNPELKDLYGNILE